VTKTLCFAPKSAPNRIYGPAFSKAARRQALSAAEMVSLYFTIYGSASKTIVRKSGIDKNIRMVMIAHMAILTWT